MDRAKTINPYELKNKWLGKDIDFSGTLITRNSLERVLNVFKKRLNLESLPSLKVGLADDREHTVSLEELIDFLESGKFSPAVTSVGVIESSGDESFYLWAQLGLEFDREDWSKFSCLSQDSDESQKDWPIGFSREIEEVRNTSHPSEDILDVFKEKFGNACVLDLDGSVLEKLHEIRGAQQKASKSKAEEEDRNAKEFKRIAIKRLIDVFVTVSFVTGVILVATLLKMFFGFDVLTWVEKILTASLGGVLQW